MAKTTFQLGRGHRAETPRKARAKSAKKTISLQSLAGRVAGLEKRADLPFPLSPHWSDKLYDRIAEMEKDFETHRAMVKASQKEQYDCLVSLTERISNIEKQCLWQRVTEMEKKRELEAPVLRQLAARLTTLENQLIAETTGRVEAITAVSVMVQESQTYLESQTAIITGIRQTVESEIKSIGANLSKLIEPLLTPPPPLPPAPRTWWQRLTGQGE